MKEKCEKFLEVTQTEFDIEPGKVYDDNIINIDSTMSDPEGFTLYDSSTL